MTLPVAKLGSSAFAVGPEPVFTWANVVTALRTAVCFVWFGVAFWLRSPLLNIVGLCVYWALDILDGYLARRLRQETRLGAQFDILSDRLLVALFYVNHLALHPHDVVAVMLFLFQFMLLDHYLSNQFLRWNILSPNYFHVVDQTIWILNWSPVAKLCNTGVATVLLVVHAPLAAACAALVAIGVKSYSLVLMLRLKRG